MLEEVILLIGSGAVYAFLGLVIFAAINDLISLTIPNWTIVACVALYGIAATVFQIGWMSVGTGLFTCLLVLFTTFALFSLNIMGGGDAKLLAVIALWYSWSQAMINFLMITAIVGGVLTLLLLVAQRTPLPIWCYTLKGIPQFGQKRPDVPYGIAICIGGILAFGDSDWSSLVMTAY